MHWRRSVSGNCCCAVRWFRARHNKLGAKLATSRRTSSHQIEVKLQTRNVGQVASRLKCEVDAVQCSIVHLASGWKPHGGAVGGEPVVVGQDVQWKFGQ